MFHAHTPVRKQGIKTLESFYCICIPQDWIMSIWTQLLHFNFLLCVIFLWELVWLSQLNSSLLMPVTCSFCEQDAWLGLEKKVPILLTLLKQIVPQPADPLVLSGITTFEIKTPATGLSAASSPHHALLKWFQQAGEKVSDVQMAFTHALHYILITGVHESATSPSVHVLQAHLENCWQGTWAAYMEVQFWRDEMKRIPKPAVSSTIMYTWSSLIKSYLGWQPSITSCIILEWLSRWCAIIRGCCFFVWGSRIQSSAWNWQPHWMLFWRRRSNGWGEWPCAGVSTRWFFLWCGYKFVGDNVDKNVKPSCQPQEIKGKSLHYCHAYAAKDRVNLALLSEYPPPKSAPDPNFTATISCGCVVAISLVYLLGICRVTCFAWPLKSSMCWTIILDKLKLT